MKLPPKAERALGDIILSVVFAVFFAGVVALLLSYFVPKMMEHTYCEHKACFWTHMKPVYSKDMGMCVCMYEAEDEDTIHKSRQP